MHFWASEMASSSTAYRVINSNSGGGKVNSIVTSASQAVACAGE